MFLIKQFFIITGANSFSRENRDSKCGSSKDWNESIKFISGNHSAGPENKDLEFKIIHMAAALGLTRYVHIHP